MSGAVAKAHMSEGAGFTYGGGGFRGTGQARFDFIQMDDDEQKESDQLSQEDRMAAKHKATRNV